MLFRVVEHYNDLPEEEIIYIEPKNECLLCLEINTDDKCVPVDLKTQQVYLKVCNCGGWEIVGCGVWAAECRVTECPPHTHRLLSSTQILFSFLHKIKQPIIYRTKLYNIFLTYYI